MIEFTGLIWSGAALQIRLEPTTPEDENVASYTVKAAVRDPAGDHLYSRSITVPKTLNILGILQAAIDELPFEAQVCVNGPWVPSQDKSKLELL